MAPPAQPNPSVVVVNGPNRTTSYYVNSTEESTDCDSVVENPATPSGVPTWVESRFVPRKVFDPEAEELPSLSQTQPAILRKGEPGTDPNVQKAYVRTGYLHGGLSTGGPPSDLHGYETVERGNTVVHNRGLQSVDGSFVDIGPAYGNGSQHSAGCKRASRLSPFQNTCSCVPRPPPSHSDSDAA